MSLECRSIHCAADINGIGNRCVDCLNSCLWSTYADLRRINHDLFYAIARRKGSNYACMDFYLASNPPVKCNVKLTRDYLNHLKPMRMMDLLVGYIKRTFPWVQAI